MVYERYEICISNHSISSIRNVRRARDMVDTYMHVLNSGVGAIYTVSYYRMKKVKNPIQHTYMLCVMYMMIEALRYALYSVSVWFYGSTLH